MGSSTSETKTNSSSDTSPWGPQVPYITSGWQDAQNIFDQRMANGPYQGDFVAAPNQQQYDSYNNAYNWATSQGENQANQQYNQGYGLVNSGTANQNAASTGYNGFLANNTAANNVANAQQYMNPQLIQAQTNAAMYDANQNAAENTLPTLYRNAAGSGNLNSDRAALAQGVVQRGLNEQASNVAAGLEANAYNQGLNMVNNTNSQNLSALGAMGSLGTNQISQGQSGENTGYNDYGKALTAQQAAGAGLQNLQQNVIDNGLKQWYNNYDFAQNNLNDMWNITGQLKGQHTDSTSDSTTTQTPSIGQMIGQGIGIFGSLFSDARYKIIISAGPVGTWKGFNTYRYVYTFAPDEIHEGPMAQEIQAARPDAVTEVFGKLIINTEAL